MLSVNPTNFLTVYFRTTYTDDNSNAQIDCNLQFNSLKLSLLVFRCCNLKLFVATCSRLSQLAVCARVCMTRRHQLAVDLRLPHTCSDRNRRRTFRRLRSDQNRRAMRTPKQTLQTGTEVNTNFVTLS